MRLWTWGEGKLWNDKCCEICLNMQARVTCESRRNSSRSVRRPKSITCNMELLNYVRVESGCVIVCCYMHVLHRSWSDVRPSPCRGIVPSANDAVENCQKRFESRQNRCKSPFAELLTGLKPCMAEMVTDLTGRTTFSPNCRNGQRWDTQSRFDRLSLIKFRVIFGAPKAEVLAIN